MMVTLEENLLRYLDTNGDGTGDKQARLIMFLEKDINNKYYVERRSLHIEPYRDGKSFLGLEVEDHDFQLEVIEIPEVVYDILKELDLIGTQEKAPVTRAVQDRAIELVKKLATEDLTYDDSACDILNGFITAAQNVLETGD